MWPPMQPGAAGRGDTLVPGTQRELPRTLDTLVQDPVAFRHWYDMVLPRVYRYLLARSGDTWLAEELTQQTFVEAVRNRRKFDGRSDVVTWLCAIGLSVVVDQLLAADREAARQQRLSAIRSEQDPLASTDERDAVLGALGALPDDQRLTLIFRYLDGMSVRQVAKQLDRTEKAVEALLSRGRDAFRQAYRGPIDD